MVKTRLHKLVSVLIAVMLLLNVAAVMPSFATETALNLNTENTNTVFTAGDIGLTTEEGVDSVTLTPESEAATFAVNVTTAGNYAMFLERATSVSGTIVNVVVSDGNETSYTINHHLYDGVLFCRLGAMESMTSSGYNAVIGNSGVMALTAGTWNISLSVAEGSLDLKSLELKALDLPVSQEVQSINATDFSNGSIAYVHLDQNFEAHKLEAEEGEVVIGGAPFEGLYLQNYYLDYSLNIAEAGYYSFGFATKRMSSSYGTGGTLSLYVNDSTSAATSVTFTNTSSYVMQNSSDKIYLKSGSNKIRVMMSGTTLMSKITITKTTLDAIPVGSLNEVEILPEQVVAPVAPTDGYLALIDGDTVSFDIEVEEAGKYAVKIAADTAETTPMLNVMVGSVDYPKTLSASTGDLQTIATVELTAGKHTVIISVADAEDTINTYKFAVNKVDINMGAGTTAFPFNKNTAISGGIEIGATDTAFAQDEYIEFNFNVTKTGNYSFRLTSTFTVPTGGTAAANYAKVTAVVDEGETGAITDEHKVGYDTGRKDRILGPFYFEEGTSHTIKITCNSAEGMTFHTLNAVNVDHTVSATEETEIAAKDFSVATLQGAHIANQTASVVLSTSCYVSYSVVPETTGWYSVSVETSVDLNKGGINIDLDGRNSTIRVENGTARTELTFDNPIYLKDGLNELKIKKLQDSYSVGINAWVYKVTLQPSAAPDLSKGKIFSILPDNTTYWADEPAKASTATTISGGESITVKFNVAEESTYSIDMWGKLSAAGDFMLSIDSGEAQKLTIPTNGIYFSVLKRASLSAGNHTFTLTVPEGVTLDLYNFEISDTDKYIANDDNEHVLYATDYASTNTAYYHNNGQMAYGTQLDGAGSTLYNAVYLQNTYLTYSLNVEKGGWYKLSVLASSQSEASATASVYVNEAETAAAAFAFTKLSGYGVSEKAEADNYIYLNTGINSVKIMATGGNFRTWRLYLERVNPIVSFTDSEGTALETIVAGDVSVDIDMSGIKEGSSLTYAIALYKTADSKTELESVIYEEGIQAQTYSSKVTVPNDGAAYKIKVFMWENMMPVAGAAELD